MFLIFHIKQKVFQMELIIFVNSEVFEWSLNNLDKVEGLHGPIFVDQT